MAGYLVREDGTSREFHVGVSFNHKDAADVVEVQLDGHELGRAEELFSNLPIARGRVVRYFGDHAKFIVANWS